MPLSTTPKQPTNPNVSIHAIEFLMTGFIVKPNGFFCLATGLPASSGFVVYKGEFY
jgi:hypothetical protein